jgi:hypothetical protein
VQRSQVENVSTKKTQYHNCVVMSYAYIFRQTKNAGCHSLRALAGDWSSCMSSHIWKSKSQTTEV